LAYVNQPNLSFDSGIDIGFQIPAFVESTQNNLLFEDFVSRVEKES
jgi:hypothetical protein